MTEHNPILVVVEAEEARIAPVTLEILSAGADLSREQGVPLCAGVLGCDAAGLAGEVAFYADRVYLIDDPLLASFQPDVFASALEALCHAVTPETVLLGHTPDNLDLAPRVACRMVTDLITDCIKLERDNETGSLLCSKPVYGGNAMAVLEISTKPQLVTIRPKVMGLMEKGTKQGEVVTFECDLSPSLTETLETIPGESVSLDKADAIVSGGRGVKTIEDIEALRTLVGALRKYFGKVELGASRPLIDAGLLPHSRQVGQTGEKVSPQIYVAVAISGAAQHMAGLLGSKKIIAINKDPEAPIFGCSDYAVVGWYEEIVPALVKSLQDLK